MLKYNLMPFRSINLALVDDHALFRRTLKFYLSDQTNLKVIIQASDMSELLNELKSASVDVLVMDLFMPGLCGSDAVKTIRSEFSEIRILVLSMSTDMDLISDLMDAGINGYISKSAEPDELMQAISAAAENRIYRNRLFTEALYWNKQNSIAACATGSVVRLHEREKRILQMIWDEKSNKEIADELFLGIRSVEKIRQDMKEKLGVKSTVGLLRYGINKKIIDFVSTNSHVTQ
jgi:DNA-binding NarL/FixJ family response regulator